MSVNSLTAKATRTTYHSGDGADEEYTACDAGREQSDRALIESKAHEDVRSVVNDFGKKSVGLRRSDNR